MTIVQIQHPTSSFDAWKVAFDRDPVGRQQSGVRRYRITRGLDDPNYVAIDLEFDDVGRAKAFSQAMQNLWRSAQAMAVLGTGAAPQLRIVEEVEARDYNAR